MANNNSFSFFPSRYIKQPLPEESGGSPLEPGACNGSRGSCEGEHLPRNGAVTDQIPPDLPLLPKVHTREREAVRLGWRSGWRGGLGTPSHPLHTASACCPIWAPRGISQTCRLAFTSGGASLTGLSDLPRITRPSQELILVHWCWRSGCLASP